MAICAGCNSHTSRLRMTVTDDRGRWLPEDQQKCICPNCSPESFHDPCDPWGRVWVEHEAKPYLYHMKPDGSFELNDSAKGDLMAEWEKDPDEEARAAAIARKRATRRTRPLEPWEIQQADNAMRPVVKQYLEDQQRQEEGDKLYTENLIENVIRKERDKSPTIQ